MRRTCAALLLLAACPAPERGEDRIAADVALSRMESCEELEAFLEEEAIDALEAEIEARMESGFLVPIEEEAIEAPRLVGDSPFERIVADRDRVFVLDGEVLRAVRSDPLEELASVSIAGDAIGVFPAGDRLFVLTRAGDRTRVTLIAREDLGVVRMVELAGTPDSAVADPSGLTLVLSGGLLLPPPADEELAIVAMDSFRKGRETEIRARTLDDWIEADDLGRDCASYHYVANAPVEPGLTRIVHLDSSDLRAEVTALIGRTAVSAAAPSAILLAVPHRFRLPRPGQVVHSYLFAFDRSGAPIGSGGVDGVPRRDAMTIGGSIRMLTAIDRRVSDPINTWGRLVREHRIQHLELSGGKLAPTSSSQAFADAQSLRAARLFEDRAFAATRDRIYVFNLEALDSFAAFPLDAPVDRLARAGSALIAASARGGELEISVLDPTSLDRALSSRTLTNLLPGTELGVALDPSGLIAVPEIGAPAPDSFTPEVAVRVLAVDDSGALTSAASIELSPLHAQRPEPPHLLYGVFVAGRPLAVSDAGVAAFDETNLAVQSLLFE
jgi:hypothetical protein